MRRSGVAMGSRLSHTVTSSRCLQQTWSPRQGIYFDLTTPPFLIKTWKSSNGIVFSSNRDAPCAKTSSRNYGSTIPRQTTTFEEDLTIHSYAEDSYVLSGHFEPSLDNNDASETVVNNVVTVPVPEHDGQLSVMDMGIVKEDLANAAKDENAHPPLEFQIPESVLQAAKSAGPQHPERFWSYKMYTGKDNRKVRLHYCKNRDATERVLQDYFVDKKVLGFDIEWRPSANAKSGPRANVSLVQLSSEDRIALIHIALFPKDDVDNLVAPSLKKIMEDPEIIKTGVSIKSDCTRMRTHLQIESRGIFELSHLHRLVKHTIDGQPELINKKLVSLATQVEEHLELPLYKGDEVRGSDWSQPLDMQQLAYAAGDSYAGFMLYNVMEAKRRQLVPIPPRPHPAEKDLPIQSGFKIQSPEIHGSSASNKRNDVVHTSSLHDDLNIDMASFTVNDGDEPLKASSRSSKEPPSSCLLHHLQSAQRWTANFQKTQDSARGRQSMAGNAQLRAYALWQHENLCISGIAVLLKVQKITAVTYILESIRLEKLPYDSDRLKVLIDMIPNSIKGTPRAKCYAKLL